jgi:hypothetical protein
MTRTSPHRTTPLWASGLQGRPPGTPSHVSPQGTSFASVPRGNPMSKEGRAISFAGNLTDHPSCGTPREGSPGPGSGWRCRAGGSWSRRSSPWWCGVTRPSTPRSPWPRAAASWSWAGSSSAPGRRVRERPAGRGRGAGAEPQVGDGDNDQDHEELQPVASSTSAAGERDAIEGAACQRSAPSLLILRVSREEFLYELKAGPAGGRLRRPSSRRQRRGVHRGNQRYPALL